MESVPGMDNNFDAAMLQQVARIVPWTDLDECHTVFESKWNLISENTMRTTRGFPVICLTRDHL
jgi:hypothetical protein